MLDILLRASYFVAIIILGFALKRIGFFKKDDFYLLSRMCLRVTLTAAIIVNFAGREIHSNMIILTIFGGLFSVILLFASYIINANKPSNIRAFSMLNSSGCNLGNFVLPFAQSFLGATGVMVLSMFDIGNAVFCLGGSYSISKNVKDGQKGIAVKPIIRAMMRSVPFVTYLILIAMSLLHIMLPTPVMNCAQIVADANAFLCMLTIGVGFELKADKEQLSSISRIIIPRYVIGITLAVLSFLFMPLPLEYRQTLAILFVSPIASSMPAFTAELGEDFGLSSAINSISILISIVLIISVLMLVV